MRAMVCLLVLVLAVSLVPQTAGNESEVMRKSFYRFGRELEVKDIIGLDKTKLDEACKVLGTPPAQGIDIEILGEIFKDVDGFDTVSGGKKDGVLDEGELTVFIDTLDAIAYCTKKAKTS